MCTIMHRAAIRNRLTRQYLTQQDTWAHANALYPTRIFATNQMAEQVRQELDNETDLDVVPIEVHYSD